MKRMTRLAAVILVAAAEALAQDEKQVCGRRIVVSLSDRKLALIENGNVVKIFQTAVGADRTPSPSGTFTIVQRLPNPTWYGPHQVVAPGVSNPLGPRWLGLSKHGYGIHGTNNPRSIGHRASHGCIRMRNSDVQQLYDMVAVGDVVELYSERTPELDRIFGTAAASAEASAGQ